MERQYIRDMIELVNQKFENVPKSVSLHERTDSHIVLRFVQYLFNGIETPLFSIHMKHKEQIVDVELDLTSGIVTYKIMGDPKRIYLGFCPSALTDLLLQDTPIQGGDIKRDTNEGELLFLNNSEKHDTRAALKTE